MHAIPKKDFLYWFGGGVAVFRFYLNAFPHYEFVYMDAKWGKGWQGAKLKKKEGTPVGPAFITNPFDIPIQGDPDAAKIIYIPHKPGLCTAAKLFKEYRELHQDRPDYKPWPHVLIVGLHRDFGAASEGILGVTSQSNWRRKEWKARNCTEEMVLEYINHPETQAIISTQYHIWDHPKVHSIPIGMKSPTATVESFKKLQKRVDDAPTEQAAMEALADRPQLTQINFKIK